MTSNPLDAIMGVQEAAELWHVHPDHVKKLCQQGKVRARKIGKSWVLIKDQSDPTKYRKREATD